MPTKRIGPGITEIEIPEKHHYGYFVRIRRQGKHYRKFFSYKRYGGKQKARKAAEEHYKQQISALPKNQSTRNIKTVRNRSGKVGVHFARDVSKRWPGCVSESYVAGWLDSKGNHIHVSFAKNKYGDAKAWKLACIARDNQLRDRERIEQIYEAGKRKKSQK